MNEIYMQKERATLPNGILGIIFVTIVFPIIQYFVDLMTIEFGRKVLGWTISLIGVFTGLLIAYFTFIKFNDIPTRLVTVVLVGALMTFVYLCVEERS